MWNIEKIIKKGDYNYCIVRNHPNRTLNDYVLLHRVIVENHLGRLLNASEAVHHKDGNKLNNVIENLEVISYVEHRRLHASKTGRLMCEAKCPCCSKIFIVRHGNTQLVSSTKKYTTCSAQCRGKFSRQMQLHGLTHNMKIAISENIIRTFREYDDAEETPISGSVETTRDPSETMKT